MPNDITTLPASLAIALLDFLPANKVDKQAVLLRAGILSSPEILANDTSSYISRAQFSRLFREVFSRLKKLDGSSSAEAWMGNEEFRMLCYCIIHRKTLGEAIEQAMRFEKMLKREDLVLSLLPDQQTAKLEYKLHSCAPSISALICDLLSLSYFYRFFTWLIGARIPIEALCMYHDTVEERHILEEMFQTPIRFNQAGNFFLFPAQLLEAPVVRSIDDLESLLDLELLPFDPSFNGASDITLSELVAQQLRRLLISKKPLPSSHQLADFYNISESTLRRKLANEGNSVSKIKEQCRMECAKDLLSNTQRTVDDIALQLGFSDGSSFRRAFKQWQHESPSQFRRRRA